MKIIILTVFSLIFQACTRAIESQPQVQPNLTTNVQDVNRTNPSPVAGVKKDPVKAPQIDLYDIKSSLGLVGTKDKEYAKDEFIRIYNRDGSLWYEFSPYDEEKARESIERNENFRPFRYTTDYNWFYFNCVGQDSRYYHVIVNDETGLKKFVRKDDPILKLGTWEMYILDCFAVGFERENNALRDEPNGRPLTGDIPKHLNFHPEKIKGDWLKVRWHDNDDDKEVPRFGWVRWKENGKIVISVYETA